MDGYDTLNEAIIAAAFEAREIFENKEEAISLVYEKDGQYFFTKPGSSDPNSSRTKAKFNIPKGSLRYIVHNHPDGKEHEFFSPDDIRNSERLRVPSAIIFGNKPIIRTFTPGLSETETFRLRRGGKQKGKRSLGDEFSFSGELRKRDIQGQISE